MNRCPLPVRSSFLQRLLKKTRRLSVEMGVEMASLSNAKAAVLLPRSPPPSYPLPLLEQQAGPYGDGDAPVRCSEGDPSAYISSSSLLRRFLKKPSPPPTRIEIPVSEAFDYPQPPPPSSSLPIVGRQAVRHSEPISSPVQSALLHRILKKSNPSTNQVEDISASRAVKKLQLPPLPPSPPLPLLPQERTERNERDVVPSSLLQRLFKKQTFAKTLAIGMELQDIVKNWPFPEAPSSPAPSL